MHVHTSYYARSGKHPRGIATSYVKCRYYPNNGFLPIVAPNERLVKAYKLGEVTIDDYITAYLFALNNERQITPQSVADQLNDGDILLCWEKVGDFCHRHVLADWLTSVPDFTITEITIAKDPSKWKWLSNCQWRPKNGFQL